MTETEKLVQACIAGIQEKKGRKIRVVNLEGIDDTITKYLVIGEGNSPSQVSALTESVREFARKQANARPSAVDGTRNNLWVALDYIDVVVHLFVPDAREFYDVDNLWEDAEITDIPDLD
ncbi:MAG: ribosome silencing factor [Bacteroidaceae bacterium]|mgnify:FL=1|nr:ribosome silencing factor [Bacteroidaceae bacterium]MBR1521549.1 ribosome silencing factor [Bacteroidaceae bacterium]